MYLMYQEIDGTQYTVCDWIKCCGDVEEPLLPNAPQAT